MPTLQVWAYLGPIVGLAVGTVLVLVGVYFKQRSDRRAEDQEHRDRETHLRAASKDAVDHQQATIAALKEEMRSKVETEAARRERLAAEFVAEREAVRGQLMAAQAEIVGRHEAATNFVRELLALGMAQVVLSGDAYERVAAVADSKLEEAFEDVAARFGVTVDVVKQWTTDVDAEPPDEALRDAIGLMRLENLMLILKRALLEQLDWTTFLLYAHGRTEESVPDRVRSFIAFKKLNVDADKAAADADDVFRKMKEALTKQFGG